MTALNVSRDTCGDRDNVSPASLRFDAECILHIPSAPSARLTETYTGV